MKVNGPKTKVCIYESRDHLRCTVFICRKSSNQSSWSDPLLQFGLSLRQGKVRFRVHLCPTFTYICRSKFIRGLRFVDFVISHLCPRLVETRIVSSLLCFQKNQQDRRSYNIARFSRPATILAQWRATIRENFRSWFRLHWWLRYNKGQLLVFHTQKKRSGSTDWCAIEDIRRINFSPCRFDLQRACNENEITSRWRRDLKLKWLISVANSLRLSSSWTRTRYPPDRYHCWNINIDAYFRYLMKNERRKTNPPCLGIRSIAESQERSSRLGCRLWHRRRWYLYG